MPILKNIKTPNGAAVAFHKAVSSAINFASGTATVNVASWASEDDHNSGAGLVWMWEVELTMAAVPDVESALVLVAPFEGGTVVSNDALSLAAVQLRQGALLEAAYFQAIAQPISFTTTAGDTRSYQSDPQSVSNASACVLGCMAAGAVPDGFYWVAADNTRVPFTYADLQAFAAALFVHGHAAFAQLQDLKAAVRAAATTDAVLAITWPTP